MLVTTVALALIAGALLGALHMRVLRAVVARSLARRSSGLLLWTAPLRLAVPAAGLTGAAALGGGAALAGALVGYGFTVQALRWSAAREEERAS